MARGIEVDQERADISKRIIKGAITGGILGAAVGFLDKSDILTIPGLGPMLAAIPVDIAVTETIVGALIGGVIGGLIKLQEKNVDGYNSHESDRKAQEKVVFDTDSPEKLQLLEEQLDISKKWIQTGEVTVYREVLTEEKNITVPVTREELVIEKKILDLEAPDSKNEHIETIRIPVSEEQIEVVKHPVVLEDVQIYNNQFQETESVKETLKKEKVRIQTTGEAKVIDKENEEH